MTIEIARADLWQTASAAAILIAGLAAAWIASRALGRVVRRITSATDTDLDDAIAAQLRAPALALVLVQAAYLALRTLSYVGDPGGYRERLWGAATLFVAVWLLWRVGGAVFAWYALQAEGDADPFRQKTLPIVRRIAQVAIVLSGGVLVLGQIGVAISPLLAGLGIGGLAVALAVQPILANIFAGSYVLSDGSIRVDDFIEIDGGPTGWVEDIGWRATRVRTFDNNLVVIPNSTLAAATVTNFDTATAPVGAAATCGVAYEEDLEHVEAVARGVLAEVAADCDAVDPSYEPVVMFLSFGESNIDLLIKLQALNRRRRGTVVHEMVKRIHTRFAAEGITINYPARRVILDEEDTEGLARLAPREGRGGANGADRA